MHDQENSDQQLVAWQNSLTENTISQFAIHATYGYCNTSHPFDFASCYSLCDKQQACLRLASMEGGFHLGHHPVPLQAVLQTGLALASQRSQLACGVSTLDSLWD